MIKIINHWVSISFIFSFLLILIVPGIAESHKIPAGFDRGGKLVWVEGDRPDIFMRSSAYQCPAGPADSAPDQDEWITVDIPLLDQTKAKAAIIFAHAWAEQDNSGESNGIGVHVSRDGLTGLSPFNQAAQTKVKLANDGGDEHSMMIVDLDGNKNFKALYHFGEMFEFDVDETQLCWWGTRIQLMGWIEGPRGPKNKWDMRGEEDED